MRKRFIAGAVCPHCQEKDTLAMWRENNVDVVEGVKCGHRVGQGDRRVREQDRSQEQVIGIFHPE